MKRIKPILIIVAALIAGFLLRGAFSPAPDTQSPTSRPETWTCSMHPQIQLPKFGKCPICFMDLIPLESGMRKSFVATPIWGQVRAKA